MRRNHPAGTRRARPKGISVQCVRSRPPAPIPARSYARNPPRSSVLARAARQASCKKVCIVSYEHESYSKGARPDVTVIRATPWQLATLCGVWNYNIQTCPAYVTAFPVLPDLHPVQRCQITLPLVSLQLLDAPTLEPVFELHLHGFSYDMTWLQDLSATCLSA